MRGFWREPVGSEPYISIVIGPEDVYGGFTENLIAVALRDRAETD
jgi:hypothetical protein